MNAVRPAHAALALLALLLASLTAMHLDVEGRRGQQGEKVLAMRRMVALLGLSDLCISTEARYTRHPAVSDGAVVFMDHPGAIDHFPSTIFFATPRLP